MQANSWRCILLARDAKRSLTALLHESFRYKPSFTLPCDCLLGRLCTSYMSAIASFVKSRRQPSSSSFLDGRTGFSANPSSCFSCAATAPAAVDWCLFSRPPLMPPLLNPQAPPYVPITYRSPSSTRRRFSTPKLLRTCRSNLSHWITRQLASFFVATFSRMRGAPPACRFLVQYID